MFIVALKPGKKVGCRCRILAGHRDVETRHVHELGLVGCIGEYDQRGPLHHRHVFALTHVPIGKESDQVEENEYIGEETGPLEHPLVAKDRTELMEFIAEVKKLRNITDRALLGRAGASAHTLRKLRKGGQVSDKSLFQLVRVAEQLRLETEPVAAANAKWLQKLREFLNLVGSQNKLGKMLGVTRPYLGRVLKGKKPMTAGMIERIRQSTHI
jgi:transcriptional regulator with XRE-family HTH domain